MLCFVVRLDVDRDQGVLDFCLQGLLDAVAYFVCLRDAHPRWHHQMEINKGPSSGMSGSQVMRLDSAAGIRRDQRANASKRAGRDGRIQGAEGNGRPLAEWR
jgi:hypothetical protein